jgi:hypothetical protein
MTLTHRLFIANFGGACFVIWAYWLGYIARVVEADGAHMAYIIATVFLAGVISTFFQASRVGKISVEQSRIGSAHLYDLYTALFILGIIGNAIGFLTAFGGVDIADLATPEGVRKAGAQLLSGAGTAFGSTLVGLTLALWTSINLRILATAQDKADG